MRKHEIEQAASSLYDGGWRSEDREQLIQEYDLSEREANEICKLLDELDK